MFWHLYIYRLKVLLKNKYLLFWQGAFPIILGTLFFMAFSDITEMTETLDTQKVVITSKSEAGDTAENIVKSNEAFLAFVENLEELGMYDMSYADYEDAIKLVEDNEAIGALIVSKNQTGIDISITFGSNGINETILKNIINKYKHGEAVIIDAMKNNPQSVESVLKELYSDENLSKDLSVNSENMDTYNQYYFALFAMTCMFGGFFGMFNTKHCQADQSAVGMRRAVSPTKKMMVVLSEFLAAITIVEIIFTVLFVYLTLVLGIDLGDKYELIFLASFMASLLGVAMGYFVGVALKCKESSKDGILTAITLFLNFLAGLMLGDMKVRVEETMPIINRINPAALISDCFYSICAYDDMNMYIRSIVSIGIWAVALAVGAIIVLRREKYANL